MSISRWFTPPHFGFLCTVFYVWLRWWPYSWWNILVSLQNTLHHTDLSWLEGKNDLTWLDLNNYVTWLALTWLGKKMEMTWLDLRLRYFWLDLTCDLSMSGLLQHWILPSTYQTLEIINTPTFLQAHTCSFITSLLQICRQAGISSMLPASLQNTQQVLVTRSMQAHVGYFVKSLLHLELVSISNMLCHKPASYSTYQNISIIFLHHGKLMHALYKLAAHIQACQHFKYTRSKPANMPQPCKISLHELQIRWSACLM